ncbi:MAG: hypothetical protein V1871_00840 [Planctomycetota bacterium]
MRVRFQLVFLLFFCLVCLLSISLSCASPYETARKYFDSGNQSYLKKRSENALIRYCQALRQIESSNDKELPSLLLKAVIYYRLYLMDANAVYRNSDDRTKLQYASFSEWLSTTDKIGFLELAFSNVISLGNDFKNLDTKTMDSSLLIQKDLIIADKISKVLDFQNTISPKTDLNIPADFIKTINLYGYAEIIKSFYLDAWLISIINHRKTIDKEDKSDRRAEMLLDNKQLLDISMNSLQNTYRLLEDTTDSLKTPEFKRLAEHYKMVRNKIDDILSDVNWESVTKFSADNFIADALGETSHKNDLILDSDFYISEARNDMNSAIEMIVKDKADKAEIYLLEALRNIICAREFSPNLSPENKHLIDTMLSDIYLNLYRLSNQ